MKRDLPKDRPPPLKIPRPGDPFHHRQLQLQQQHAYPPAAAHGQPPLANPSHRQPVIIHTYSPEVIQIEADKFRQLVQRLTGPAGGPASSSQPPPPRKRPRVGAPPPIGTDPNPSFSSTQADSSLRDMRVQQEEVANPSSSYVNLPHNPFLSPSLFDFSPSLLPSPSPLIPYDYLSPTGLRGAAALPSPLGRGGGGSLITSRGFPAGLVSPRGLPTPQYSLAAALPSPGPLSASFLADLPILSPAAYSWIEKHATSAEEIVASRPLMASGLPPRPPPSTTANLFPVSSSSSLEDEKPFAYHTKG